MNRLRTTIAILSVSGTAHAEDASVTLFTNVRVFDGTSSQLSAPSNVLNAADQFVESKLFSSASLDTQFEEPKK